MNQYSLDFQNKIKIQKVSLLFIYMNKKKILKINRWYYVILL